MPNLANARTYCRHLTTQLFTAPSSTPPFLEYFLTLFELFTFTLFISSHTLTAHPVIFPQIIQRNLIILLSLLLLLRHFTRLSLVKAIYALIIVWNVQCEFTIVSIFVYLLLLTHVVIDILSKIEFSFESKNVHTSTYPWILAVHYIGVVVITVVRFVPLPMMYIFPLCEIAATLLLFVVQYRSISKYQDYKNLMLRFYLLSCFYALGELYEIFITP